MILSNRQLPMLEALRSTDYISYQDAQIFDQRPFGSMWRRKYMAFRPGKGFHITEEGRQAWRTFHETEIFRKNPFGPLSSYFDAAAYGLDKPRTKLKLVKKAG